MGILKIGVWCRESALADDQVSGRGLDVGSEDQGWWVSGLVSGDEETYIAFRGEAER